MGLDTSFNCWCGGYMSFNIWRDEVARAGGYKIIVDLETKREVPDINWEGITNDNLWGNWDPDPEDVLMVLIAHYDCVGMIRHKYCKPLADRLQGLMSELLVDPGHHVERTEQFIKGLLEANEDVRFY